MMTATQRLAWLEQQLAQGWRVDAPVIERAQMAGNNNGVCAYEFVLRHEQGCQAVSVPDSPELHSFLRKHQLRTIAFYS